MLFVQTIRASIAASAPTGGVALLLVAIQLFLAGGVISLVGCSTTPVDSQLLVLSEVVSPTKVYSILPMLGGWSRDLDGLSTHQGSDLVLRHEETGVTAIFFLTPGASDSLDGSVAARRQVIEEHYEIIALTEKRGFHSQGLFAPISISDYRVREPQIEGWWSIVSSVVRGPAATVEILALGGGPPQNMMLMEDLIAGLRIFGQEESRP